MLKNTRFGLGIHNKFTIFFTYITLSLAVFPFLSFLIPENGFSFPGENLLTKLFPAITVYSNGSFNPEVSKAFFSVGFVYFIIAFLGIIATSFIDLEKKEECLQTASISKSAFKKKSHFFYAIAFLISANVFLIVSNFDIFSVGSSVGALTGRGLTLYDLTTYPSFTTNYFLPMYHSRMGLAISGTLLIAVGWASIVGMPFWLRILRCFILAN